MPQLINLPSFADSRGCLTVLENKLPFTIKRVYWITQFDGNTRANHRHFKTIQAFVALNGSLVFQVKRFADEQEFLLDSSDKCLILQPDEWHSIHSAKNNAIVLALASHDYDPNDYANEPLI